MEYMIQCEFCEKWKHGSCVDVAEEVGCLLEMYACPECRLNGKSSIGMFFWSFLNVLNVVARGNAVDKLDVLPILSRVEMKTMKLERDVGHDKSSEDFRNYLLNTASFGTAGIRVVEGKQFTSNDLLQNGLHHPLLIGDDVGGIGLNCTGFETICDRLNALHGIKYVDGNTHGVVSTTVQNWKQHVPKLRNGCVSILNTELENSICCPGLVQRICWKNKLNQLKCIPEMKDCIYLAEMEFLDFTMRDAGASLWVLMLQGECNLYLVDPTKENLASYVQWMNSLNRHSTFFGTKVDVCTTVHLKPGSSFLLPAGYAIAYYAVSECVITRESFHHSLDIQSMLNAHETELQLLSPRVDTKDVIAELWNVVDYYIKWCVALNSANSCTILPWEKEGLLLLSQYLLSKPQPSHITNASEMLQKLQSGLSNAQVPENYSTLLLEHAFSTDFCSCVAKKCPKCNCCVRTHCRCCATSTTNLGMHGQFENFKIGIESYEGLKTDPPRAMESIMSLDDTTLTWASTALSSPVSSVDAWWSDKSPTKIPYEAQHSVANHNTLPSRAFDDLGLEFDAFEFGENFVFPQIPGNDTDSSKNVKEENDSTLSDNGTEQLQLDMISLLPDSDCVPSTKHRASCHRCGNLRKKIKCCTNCPHVFCQKCAEKMINEHGANIFLGGCPVCKEVCCCGKNRNADCPKKYHCYKKCPSTKRLAAIKAAKRNSIKQEKQRQKMEQSANLGSSVNRTTYLAGVKINVEPSGSNDVRNVNLD